MYTDFLFSFLCCRQSLCQFCPLKFITNDKLAKHMRNQHNENRKKFTCNICDKQLSTAASLRTHLHVHSNIYRYKCTFCDKQFKFGSNLKCHIGTHTGERPFKCGICPMSFTSTSSAAVHRRLHKQGDSYKCLLCSTTCESSKLLNYHMRDEHDCRILFTARDIKRF